MTHVRVRRGNEIGGHRHDEGKQHETGAVRRRHQKGPERQVTEAHPHPGVPRMTMSPQAIGTQRRKTDGDTDLERHRRRDHL
jgi:hypothetical protein